MAVRKDRRWPKRDIFFPPSETKGKPSAKAMAMRDEAWFAYCRTCPVLEQCFEFAVEHETYGVWAGTTELDRARLRLEYESNRDPELLEYARNRLRAGYVPIPSTLCIRKGCVNPVSRKGTLCRYHKLMLKRSEERKR
jgi:hypothetical protein